MGSNPASPTREEGVFVCGRFVRTFTNADLVAELQVVESTNVNLDANWNVPPTSRIAVIGFRDSKRALRIMEWGLIPKWSKDATRQSSMINARVETAHEKPSFRNLIKNHRVVIPMDGFYEWDRSGTKKQPYYFYPSTEKMLCVAGLWSSWDDPTSGDTRSTVAMLTTEANSDMGGIHDRMPCLLRPEELDAWLDPKSDALVELATLRSAVPGRLNHHLVDPRVNSVRNNGPELIVPKPSVSD